MENPQHMTIQWAALILGTLRFVMAEQQLVTVTQNSEYYGCDF